MLQSQTSVQHINQSKVPTTIAQPLTSNESPDYLLSSSVLARSARMATTWRRALVHIAYQSASLSCALWYTLRTKEPIMGAFICNAYQRA